MTEVFVEQSQASPGSANKIDKSCNLFKFLLVLLSASVERVGVSRMRDFFMIMILMVMIGSISFQSHWN